MDNNVPSNENLFYSDLKTRLQRDRREERLYIRLTKIVLNGASGRN